MNWVGFTLSNSAPSPRVRRIDRIVPLDDSNCLESQGLCLLKSPYSIGAVEVASVGGYDLFAMTSRLNSLLQTLRELVRSQLALRVELLLCAINCRCFNSHGHDGCTL